MEMMLQTQNLCKYFRKQKAVNNVSLNIEKGQIYGLLGLRGGEGHVRSPKGARNHDRLDFEVARDTSEVQKEQEMKW